VGAYAHEDKAPIEAAAITPTRFARIFSNSGIRREGSGFKISKWSSWLSPPYELRLGPARCRCDVFPVPKPLTKACFVIVEDDRFAIGRFYRQGLLLVSFERLTSGLPQKQQPSIPTDARKSILPVILKLSAPVWGEVGVVQRSCLRRP
jgi:hypothetical protein